VVEVTNITGHGFWILLRSRELFLPFATFPWFQDATVAQILAVEVAGPGHLYWPELDVDLAVRSIEKPEAFPLVAKPTRPSPKRARPKSTLPRGRSARWRLAERRRVAGMPSAHDRSVLPVRASGSPRLPPPPQAERCKRRL
jgi:hypothetical protein